MTTQRHQPLCLAVILLFAALPLLIDRPAPSLLASNRQDHPPLKPYIYPTSHCRSCHDQDRASTYAPDERESMICRMVESGIHDPYDKHALAYNALTSERGRLMSERLGQDVTQIEACLACHATTLPEPGAQINIRLTDGITCVGCHGPYANWVETHQRHLDPEWRGLDRTAKERHYGMNDLWNLNRRASLCVSCHVGNAAERKVVTHAMYAAGHPPLPSFELAHYTEIQPRHWQLAREKTPARLARINVETPDPFEQTRSLLVGALQTLGATAALLAEQASGHVDDIHGAEWPDFARFDCYACHHDLKSGDSAAWRQQRGYRGAPGRPPLPEWPATLAALAVEPSEATNLNTQLETLHAAATSRPFGDASRLAEAARSLANWAFARANQAEHAPIDPARARALLQRITQIAAERLPDYDTARQLAWAFHTIHAEMIPTPANDDPIAASLRELDQALGLDLGQMSVKHPIEASLPERLQTLARYDPAAVQTLLKKIAIMIK